MQIKTADSDEEISACYDLMIQLGGRRAMLSASDFLAQVKRQKQECGYELAALSDEGAVKAIAGYRFAEYLAWGKILYVDDLATDETARSKGYGKALLDWLEARARAEHCDALRLDSGTARKAAHRFYLTNRMEIDCFHFLKELK